MWISQARLKNIRGFIDTGEVGFSKSINIIVGQNNSGKSTILNSIHLLQRTFLYANLIRATDVREGEEEGEISLNLEEAENSFHSKSFFIQHYPRITYNLYKNSSTEIVGTIPKRSPTQDDILEGQGVDNFESFSQNEPDNVIYSHSSKRKVQTYDESIKSEHKTRITGDYRNLYAKVDKLCSSTLPDADEFRIVTRGILGFPVSSISTENGKQIVLELSAISYIPLTQMGEGVASLLGLIVDLSVAEKKVFIIEEPENDVHPKALKALLELIEKKSENNQFFISTHSNIVTKYLGSAKNAKVFRITMTFDNRLPTSEINEVENNTIARLRLLEELGYEPFDFGYWKAWLFLEESSAEVIIRDFLIPHFVPQLENKLRTYSAGSRDEIEPKFRDFKNLFVFIHLEEIYKNKAWVLIDGGDDEKVIIEGMKDIFSESGWSKENFQQLSKHDFEEYYPKTFEVEVNEIFKLSDKKEKRNKKRDLIEKVKQWTKDNPEQAEKEFAESAKEVIDVLNVIAKQII